jgi:hypothetical protein
MCSPSDEGDALPMSLLVALEDLSSLLLVGASICFLFEVGVFDSECEDPLPSASVTFGFLAIFCFVAFSDLIPSLFKMLIVLFFLFTPTSTSSANFE